MSAELIPDPDFDDPAAWEIIGLGGQVTGGQLVFTVANVPRAAPVPDATPIIGNDYDYSIDVASVVPFGITGRALFGGVEIWNRLDGAGSFSGQIVAVAAAGLVFQALPATYSVNRVSIFDVRALMSTIANDAFNAIITRLQAILVSGGYNTDAGNQVYNGVRFFQDDATFPILTVFSGDEQVEKLTYNNWRLDRAVSIEGYVKDASTPTTSIEKLIEDIQQAIEQPDISLGGIVEVIDYTGVEEIDPPVAGSDISGVRVTYVFTYRRVYGA